MELKQITKTSAEFPRAAEIYDEAFPPVEKAPLDLLLKAQEAGKCGVYALTDEEKTVGFSCIVPLGQDVLYLMFLAIDASERGHGYGTKVMQLLKATYPEKTKIFMVEKPDETCANNTQRLKRISFYERFGFVLTDIEKELLGEHYLVMAEKGVPRQKAEDAVAALYAVESTTAEIIRRNLRTEK